MKILPSFLIFAIGMALGLLTFYLIAPNPGKKDTTKKTGFYLDDKHSLSKQVDWPTAWYMHESYVRDLNNNIKFTYHDPKLKPTDPPVTSILEGFSFDPKELTTLLGFHPDRVYVMLAESMRPVSENGTGPDDKIFSTILVGLRKGDPNNATDTNYHYIQDYAVDYSNPCPPYCPHNP